MVKQTKQNDQRTRPFADVPRSWLTIAVVIGGLIGLLLSQIWRWTDLQTFAVTLAIAAVCAFSSAWLHRATHR